MTRPFKLVPITGRLSHDTVKCLRSLLERAEAGEVIGVAYTAMSRERVYSVHTCGELHRNPTFCRGAVMALSDKVSRLQWSQQ